MAKTLTFRLRLYIKSNHRLIKKKPSNKTAGRNLLVSSNLFLQCAQEKYKNKIATVFLKWTFHDKLSEDVHIISHTML